MKRTSFRRRRALCTRRRRNDQGGQALVEFVLALPILLVIVFGIIEFASAWRTYQIVTNVAREGARLAVTPAGTVAAVTQRVDSLLAQSGLSTSLRTLTLSCSGTAGTLCDPVTGAGQQDEVQLDYQHSFVVLGPALNLMCANCGSNGYGTVTLTSRSVMRSE